jgi:hypothetical protein
MLNAGISTAWLGYDKRKPFERRLAALAAFLNPQNRPKGIELTPEQKAFGEFWSQLSDQLRNAFHHHGMRQETVNVSGSAMQKVTSFWNDLKAGKMTFPELGGGGGASLITAQGSRPGVLYSALKATTPDRCLVVCSAKTELTIGEAAAQAAFAGQIDKLTIKDAFSGFGELDALVKRARGWLLDADEVVANLTGGTTLMGMAVQQLVEAAERLDRPSHRFALIDRRPSAEQEKNPYVASDVYWLDAEPDGGPDGDD